jgi:hypothetical protein
MLTVDRIQAIWKGFRARKDYRRMLLNHPPEASNLQGRKMFFAAKLEHLTDQLIDSIEAERIALEHDLLTVEEDEQVRMAREFLRFVTCYLYF